ncbi:MAG: ester cyclase [Actinomycetota bacterium]|nr:ester cyclase [Actinomycetota bacterium]MDH5279225.1 ester cyclase [Actinomycetota bacterium]
MPGAHDLVSRFYADMWNPFDVSVLDDLVTDDVRFRGSLGDDLVGREALAGYVRGIQAAFPDFHNEVVELLADQDRAAARLRYTGTHRGEVLGVHGTGRRVSYDGAAFFTFEGDRVSAVWVLGDRWALRQQLTSP